MFYTELNSKIDYSRDNLRWNAWGAYGQDFFRVGQMQEILAFLSEELQISEIRKTPPFALEEITLPKSSFTPTQIRDLSKIVGAKHFSLERRERVLHSAGRSYYDVLRLSFNTLKSFVDGVAYPSKESEVSKILEYCSKNNITVIPFGGGSSVVGGLEVIKGKGQKYVLSLDTTRMDSLLSLDKESHLATFQTGIYGPKLEKLLNDKGFTLGHFPQSFEYSTLGGWIAARSAGQQSNRYGKIEEILTCLKIVTPSGVVETLREPASSTGPDLNRIFAGSEGLLGLITEATIKVHKLPEARKYFGIVFPNFAAGVDFIREVNHREIPTSMIRLSDKNETRLYQTLGALGKKKTPARWIKNLIQTQVLKFKSLGEDKCVILLGLDGSKEDVSRNFSKIKPIISLHRGLYVGTHLGEQWIHSRYNMPFLRNHLMENGIGVDTMETSTTYDRVLQLHREGIASLEKSIPGSIAMCHISHSYHEGACLYYTILFPMDEKKPADQWFKMKRTVSETFFQNGAPISHHHGVGFDHKIWYEKATSKPALLGLRAFKKEIDPKEILNPGKVFH
ncbi:FAD binding domain protein [Leptospira weilii serovar Ranarum str. ICFT]|uniref:FAD binding domain protein n=1 Tax=Leptospira weilii serovar Ranarum str. ICFT TaxID=1218598 RepID=N1WPV3_9LEPT|nr:FAD-binding oxidoreductase [Leptospira weilii]EMY79159.1 FAD binding domain protein [Leptospira weilii serovar Ranarum str. ICFT]